MKTLYTSISLGIALATSAPAAWMANGLPANAGAGGVTQGFIYGSTFDVSGPGFFATDVALFANARNSFTQNHTVNIWKLTGSTYTPLSFASASFSATSQGTPVSPAIQSGRNFRSLELSEAVEMRGGSYFIGFSNATGGDNFLTYFPVLEAGTPSFPMGSTSQAATIGTNNATDIKESLSGFAFTGTGRVSISTLNGGGGFTQVASGTGQNIQFGNFGNMSIFANLVEVPEVGSALMGTLLGGLALSYRRRKLAI